MTPQNQGPRNPNLFFELGGVVPTTPPPKRTKSKGRCIVARLRCFSTETAGEGQTSYEGGERK